MLEAPRISDDLDIFHDAKDSTKRSHTADCAHLKSAGYQLFPTTRLNLFETRVEKDGQSTNLQWSHDSACRYFPLRRSPDLGVHLHPFDLATNKVLALVGRLVIRD